MGVGEVQPRAVRCLYVEVRDTRVTVAEFKLADVTAGKTRAENTSAALLAAAEHRAEWAVIAAHRRRVSALLRVATRGWLGMAAGASRAAKTGERMWRRRMQSLAREALYAWAQDTAAALRMRDLSARAVWRYRANTLGKPCTRGYYSPRMLLHREVWWRSEPESGGGCDEAPRLPRGGMKPSNASTFMAAEGGRGRVGPCRRLESNVRLLAGVDASLSSVPSRRCMQLAGAARR